MAVFSLAPRRRLVATCAVAGLLVAAGSAAAAATPASPGAPAPSTTTSPTPQPQGPRNPDATAPPGPTDYGPPCTTDATAQHPVVCLPAGSGEDEAAPLTPGDVVEFDAQVVNNGPAVADADAVITLPKGLELESDEDDPVSRVDGWYGDGEDDGDYTALTCQDGPTSTTCSVGTLAAHANILVAIDLQVAKDAATGTTLSFQVALLPVGTPTYPSTSVTARIDVLQTSHLEVSLTPATLRTVVGHRATMTGIVHNAGPGTAPSTVAVAVDLDESHPDRTHFTITDGTDATGGGAAGGESDSAGSSSSAYAGPIAGGTTVVVIGAASSAQRARLQRQALSHAASAGHAAVPSLRYWPLGTIAPGATATVAIELRALTVGTDTLTFGALSASTELDCFAAGGPGGGSGSGVPSAGALVRAPRAVSTTSAPAGCPFALQTHITAVPAPAAAPLANTGSRTDTELGIALWALLLGSLLVWVGRRRRIPVRRHG